MKKLLQIFTKSEKPNDTFEKWNDFPPEVKQICIGKMDFHTRFNLQYTSKTEHSLVNEISEKFPIFEVHVNKNHLEIRDYKSSRIENYSIQILPYLMKSCTIQNFHIYWIFEHKIIGKSRRNLEEMFSENIPNFEIRNFYAGHLDRNTVFVIKNSWPKVEKIELKDRWCSNSEGLLEVLKFSSFKNVFKFSTDCPMTAAEGGMMIEMLIQNDSKISTQLKLPNYFTGSPYFNPIPIYSMDPIWLNRIIFKKGYCRLRIQTDNPEKHIYLYGEESDSGYLYCSVIPANLEDRELEDYEYFC